MSKSDIIIATVVVRSPTPWLRLHIYVAMGMDNDIINFWILNVVMITGCMAFCVVMFGFIRREREKYDDGQSYFKR